MTTDLQVDPLRVHDYKDYSGVYVLAKLNDRWGSYDIATLERNSLVQWLQESPARAPYIVCKLLNFPIP